MATYAGLSGGISGATHWSLEDIAIMCGIPEMTVIEPCDEIQAKRLLDVSVDYEGPIYIRSSVEPMVNIYDEGYTYEIGKASIVNEGDDGAFICAGVTVKYALQAALEIEKEFGKKIRVIDMHTIKPIDRQTIRDAAQTGFIVAAQDHNIFGGLGTQVAQVLAEEGLSCRFANVGVPDRFVAMAHAPYLYHKFGFDADGLKQRMLDLWNKI